jgi:hypothetical protein
MSNFRIQKSIIRYNVFLKGLNEERCGGTVVRQGELQLE